MPHSRGLIYVIKQLEMGMRRPFFEVVTSHGLNWGQYTALTVLHRLPGLTSSELARRSFVRPQSMAETLTPLVDAGLARREPNPDHGRQLLLSITPAGIEKIEAMGEDVRALEDRMLRDLDDDEIVQLMDFLRRVRHGVEDPAPVEAAL
ncbi:MarR family winged helix-turn-helix transcriptional regulator [Microbacterium sp. G2-8]|uniref:MarR family winged helix-turn-helix transcriptional regulator n=1 Tax=Microbacterium sp. G2-8 TaxID=2842454 RepID=UPI001C89E0E8|nr:MarR family transcriptional regulator [Microbacterium sp. G2-8]